MSGITWDWPWVVLAVCSVAEWFWARRRAREQYRIGVWHMADEAIREAWKCGNERIGERELREVERKLLRETDR
jgi:hypothetical protein